MMPTSDLVRRALIDQEEQIARSGALTPQMIQAQQTQARWKQFPGSRPGGTGPTGLNSQDAQGWTDMQNDNLAGMEAISGEPVNVRGNYNGTNFADQSFSIGGGMDAHQEQRARLLEALMLNSGNQNALGQVRQMKGRW